LGRKEASRKLGASRALKVKRMGSRSVEGAGEPVYIFVNQTGVEGEAGN